MKEEIEKIEANLVQLNAELHTQLYACELNYQGIKLEQMLGNVYNCLKELQTVKKGTTGLDLTEAALCIIC